MATATIQLMSPCSGGGHFTLQVTGDVTATIETNEGSISGELTRDDIVTFVKVLIRFARIGRTAQQVRTALVNGFSVTI